MFEQVCDAGRAQYLVDAAYLVLDHERHGRRRRLGQDKEPHAVVERVLHDGQALARRRLRARLRWRHVRTGE